MALAVIQTGRNCAAWAAQSVTSILTQTDPPDAHVIVDDASDDGTDRAIGDAIVAHGAAVVGIRNPVRYGALQNLQAAVEVLCPDPDDILVTVDLDDWLTRPHVLTRVRQVYRERPETQLTFGGFVVASTGEDGWTSPYPSPILETKTYRLAEFRASHLRTFRARLWQAIRPADLVDPTTGLPWAMAWDCAMMFPMLEMCRPDQIVSLHGERVYAWNDANPMSDHRLDQREQFACADRIRALPRYDTLPELRRGA